MGNDDNKEIPVEKLSIKLFDPVGNINDKFDFYIKIVIGVLLVAVVTMMLMVGTLIIDSFHFNSATYKEYSEKLDSITVSREVAENSLLELKQAQEVNATLLEQNRKLMEGMTILLNNLPDISPQEEKDENVKSDKQ